MNIKQNLLDKSKFYLKCPYEMKPKYITIHNTANDASAANEINYMISNGNQTSFHLAVDDKEAIQGIPFNCSTWNAGDGSNGSGNRQSISIEICYSKSGGDRFNKAVENCIELVAQLMKQYNIPLTNIRYHQDWSGKYCPHRLLDMGITADKFRQLVKQKMEGNVAMSKYYKDVPADAWYAEAVDYCREKGLMNGISANEFNPAGSISRAHLAVVMMRLHKMLKQGY